MCAESFQEKQASSRLSYGAGHVGVAVAVLLPGFAIKWWQNQVTRQPLIRDLTQHESQKSTLNEDKNVVNDYIQYNICRWPGIVMSQAIYKQGIVLVCWEYSVPYRRVWR